MPSILQNKSTIRVDTYYQFNETENHGQSKRKTQGKSDGRRSQVEDLIQRIADHPQLPGRSPQLGFYRGAPGQGKGEDALSSLSSHVNPLSNFSHRANYARNYSMNLYIGYRKGSVSQR